MNNKVVPIFYACDDAFIKYAIVSLTSMIKNANKEYKYQVYFLHTNISKQRQDDVLELENDNFSISFIDVKDYLKSISNKLPIRDYYSKTTYYRLFIAEIFKDLDKAIYIDADTIIQGDISELYFTDIKDNWVGACHEQVMIQTPVFGEYVEKVIGISRYNFFNAGLLLINCKQFRDNNVLDKFFKYLDMYLFVVTQDEDYLNLICKDHVYWLKQNWNTEVFGEIAYPINEACMIHYVMTNKPWHYSNCRFADIFYKYAKETKFYDDILNEANNYPIEKQENDKVSGEKLVQLAISEINKEDNFLNIINEKLRAKDRVKVLKKMEEYEENGIFDRDLEDDPETIPLLPEDINYLKKDLVSKCKTKFAYYTARKFLNKSIKDKNFIIKGIEGIENFKNLDSGAVITCNHFNPFDSFAIQLAYEASEQKKRTFYRVIREGNYTSFPGFYGFLMRNCNTLPLSSNVSTMKKFVDATDTLLKEGNFVLIYPEQSLWWNYRKPKPLKKGAFTFASKNNVPVLPCFITMKDSNVMGDDGFYVQEYTIHIDKPIYPDLTKTRTENTYEMMDKNYNSWKNIYEKTYDMPLIYNTKKAD